MERDATPLDGASRFTFGFTVFLSAFLLFQIQLMLA
jgi:hypothetical protein